MPMDVPSFHGHIGDSRRCHLDAVSRFRIGERAADAVCYTSRAVIHARFRTQLLCTATEYTVACDRKEHVSGAALEATYGERASSSGTR